MIANFINGIIIQFVNMKLYFVSGIRHSAVVFAKNKKEAIVLAEKSGDTRVLIGHVGNWESPDAEELRLPTGWNLVKIKNL